MKQIKNTKSAFPSAAEDVQAAQLNPSSTASELLAYHDHDFLLRDELRAVRLQLEWLKPDIVQEEMGIESTVVIFGGARFPDPATAEKRFTDAKTNLQQDPTSEELQKRYAVAEQVVANSQYYVIAQQLAKRITELSLAAGGKDYVIVTGGGPGVMEAANKGASEAGGRSIGLNIVLPYEQTINPYVTPELKFQFHYFAIRKMHFLKRAKALIACPGGFGTLDELFETLTLIQTKKIDPVPVILVGSSYWNKLIDFEFLVSQGAIEERDLELFKVVDSADEAWQILTDGWDAE